MNKGMEKKVYRILALNFGSTSSKLAYFENDVCRASSTLAHPAKELEQFPTFWAQEEYRLNAVAGFLQQNGIRPSCWSNPPAKSTAIIRATWPRAWRGALRAGACLPSA